MAATPQPGMLMLSHTQESLWLFHQLAGFDEPAYNESVAFDIRGPLDPDALRGAVHATVLRHEALRTTFLETPDGPRARVHEDAPDNTTFADLRTIAVPQARIQADELLARHHRQPFDLGRAPLLRALLVALPGDLWLLCLTAHHIAVDDWSVHLILDEIGENYRALSVSDRIPERPPTGAAFRAFVAASRTTDATADQAAKIERWRQSLSRSPELLGMPLDRTRPAVQTFRGDSVTLAVPRADVEPLLKECASACRSTAFPVFLAAYAVLLNRYTRQDGFAVGTTVLNRPGAEDLDDVGCYVNTLPLYVPVDPDDSFRTVLGSAQEAAERLLDDGDVPFPKVVEALGVERPRDHNPVFQTMLTLLGGRPALDLGPALATGYRPVRRAAAKFDLMLYVEAGDDAYAFELEFNTDLFTRETAERILGNYAQLLASLGAAGVDARVGTVSMTREADRRLVLDEWNDTRSDYPAGTVVDVIEEQVRRAPDVLAVAFEGEHLTYDELNRRANRVAHRIRRELAASGGGPFVGVFMERSVEMVVALLAIVKAGAAYVPIDPEYPAARIAFMVQDADLPLIITQEHHRAALGEVTAEVLVLPDPRDRDEDDADPVRESNAADPVYMIYTSGSTGQPKGVVNRHDALANRLHWMQSAFPLTREDRVLQKTPYSFDVSVWEFFWPLMTGAAIVVARPGGHRDPDHLKELIRAGGVTTVHFVPSMLNVFLEADGLAAHCGSLRRVICSGEALPRKSIEVFTATLPACELHNLYGPTEAAIDVSHWPCTTDYPGETVPIGTPIANVRLYVLDEDLRLQPVGVPGELCIGGVAVATGYHRREELTARRFVPDPYGTGPGARLYRTGDLARFLPDGQLQYLGRIDDQVKLRGLRVEPGEIAAVLRELPGVQDAAVVVDASGPAQALAAYVVSPAFDAEDLRARLRELLPEFLVPQYLVRLDALPTTPNGKLDRRALPAPTAGTAATASPGPAPTTDAERAVARAWQEVLGLAEPVGLDSHFFALGGDSILALRVSSRLRAAGYPAGLRDVFAHATLGELAASLTRGTAAEAAATPPFALVSDEDRALLPADAVDAWPLTKLQSGMIYHSLLDEDSPVYHDIFDYELTGVTDPEHLAPAVRDTVDRHPQLRSCFDLENYEEPLQIVLAQAGPAFEVVDLSHLPGDAQDKAVEDWIEAEKGRPFDLARPPVRFCVHVRGAGRANLAISFHHLLLDGWSVALVVEEIRRRCGTFPGERPTAPAPSYATYVALERESAQRPEDRAAWRRLLGGHTATLVAGRPSPGQEAGTAAVERRVPVELEARLRRRAAALGLPVKSLYLAAHCIALAELSGASRVIAGLVGNGRPEIPGGTEMVGLFLNTLPFPVEVGEADDPMLPAAVFARERELIPLQRYPLADIEREYGGALFDVVFNYTDFHAYAEGAGGPVGAGGAGGTATGGPVTIASARYFELTNFPVLVHVHRDHFADATEIVVCHDPSRIKTATAEAFLDDFLAALGRYAAAEEAAGQQDETELAVARIIAGAVGRGTLGADENYLDAGVDSITSIRILVKLRKVFPAAAMRDVMEARTVRTLVHRLAGQAPVAEAARSVASVRAVGPLPEGVVDAYPLTATQMRMLAATRQDPAQSAYHDVFAYTVALPLDEPRLRASLRRMIGACETLRTSFDVDARRQFVHACAEPDLTVFDGEPADAWFERERGSGFAWDRPPLRFAAHRIAENRFVLSLSFHHAIVDGWSLSLLVRDLLLAYSGEAVQWPQPGSFRAYVEAEAAARESAESQGFWRDVLAGHPGTALPRFASDGSGARWAESTVVVPAAQEAELRGIARNTGHPLKHVLLAAHLRVLALLTGEPDVVTGVFTHGRPETDGAEALVGMFLNFQPHRARVDGQTWPELIDEVFAFDMRALAHRRCAAPAEPRYAALFNYTDFPAYADVVADRAHLTDVRWFEHTDAPLLATVGRDPARAALEITLNADGRRIPQAALDDLARLYSAVLAQLAGHPAGRVHDVTDEIRTRTDDLRARQNPST